MDTKARTGAPFVREPAAGSTVDVLGVTHLYKATGSETAGSLSVWEAVFPPNAGAPPHTHYREDEAFYVLSGELLVEFEGEGEAHRVAAGGFFFGARGWRHAVRNVTDRPARVLIMCTPSCGLDTMFAEIEVAAAAGRPGIPKLAAIAAKYGVIIDAPGA